MTDLQPIDPESTYPFRAAAALVGLSETTLRRAARMGQLPTIVAVGTRRVRGRDLEAWRAGVRPGVKWAVHDDPTTGEVRDRAARLCLGVPEGCDSDAAGTAIDPDRVYTMLAARKAKGVAVRAIQAAVASGHLPATKRGWSWAIRGSDLIAWTPRERPAPPGWLSLGEAAKAVSRARSTLYTAIRAGRLSATFARGRWLVAPDDLAAWWASVRARSVAEEPVAPGRLYTRAEAARQMGVSKQAIGQAVRRGRLPTVKTADGPRVLGRDLLRWHELAKKWKGTKGAT